MAAENAAFVLTFFREPLGSEVFLAEADAFFSAGFWGARAAFLAGLAVLARAADALDCVAVFFCAFDLAGFFAAFFFGELAIIFGIALG
ncbi:MAG TPA: hypothetical protein VNP98_17995 [Chthoniobacterales bacterium]|nr:hypothetical protein [Chthoniobacterales bacterium]